MSRHIVFDIETDGLLQDVTKIHCISTHDVDTGLKKHYGPNEVGVGLVYLMTADTLIGHNIMGYDIPAIKKLYPNFDLTGIKIIDTLTAGCILHPDDRIMSLDAWAKKLHLKQQKVANEDWSVYTPHMKVRCDSDVEINVAAYFHLINNSDYEMIGESLETEQAVSYIHQQQAVDGVDFDIQEAILLLQELDSRIRTRRKQIVDLAPKFSWLPGVAKCNQEAEKEWKAAAVRSIVLGGKDHLDRLGIQCYKKDGTYTVNTKNYFGTNKEYLKVKGPYSKVEIRGLNPDADGQVKELLLSLGWKPTEWNFKKDKSGQFVTDHSGQRIPTSPKLTEDSYVSLPPGLGTMVAEYNMLCHRRSFLLNKKGTKGALIAVQKRGDGRVSADAFTCGTNTGRYRHSGTVCNIPRPSSTYGKQIRSLFRAAEGKTFVGVDLSGIEARCLAWYLLNGKYTKARETADLILSPDKGNDFHSYNAKQWGVSRDIAKNGLYALLYGAGAAKLANTLGKPESKGAALKKAFFKAHPGIAELIGDLEHAFSQRKYIKNIDGRPLYIRSKTKLLNTLLQGTAAVVFKKWMIKLQERMMPGVRQVIAYHDELQFEVDDEVTAKIWAGLCTSTALVIGREMGAPIPIEAEAKIGDNWGDTH